MYLKYRKFKPNTNQRREMGGGGKNPHLVHKGTSLLDTDSSLHASSSLGVLGRVTATVTLRFCWAHRRQTPRPWHRRIQLTVRGTKAEAVRFSTVLQCSPALFCPPKDHVCYPLDYLATPLQTAVPFMRNYIHLVPNNTWHPSLNTTKNDGGRMPLVKHKTGPPMV